MNHLPKRGHSITRTIEGLGITESEYTALIDDFDISPIQLSQKVGELIDTAQSRHTSTPDAIATQRISSDARDMLIGGGIWLGSCSLMVGGLAIAGVLHV